MAVRNYAVVGETTRTAGFCRHADAPQAGVEKVNGMFPLLFCLHTRCVTFPQARAGFRNCLAGFSTTVLTGCAHAERRVPHGLSGYPQPPVDHGLVAGGSGALRSACA